MYAYAPDGTPIVYTKETIPGTCGVAEDAFSKEGESLSFDHDGSGTRVNWDGQETVTVRGQAIFLDAADREWPECALVLVHNEIDEDADDEADRVLPAAAVTAALAAHAAWKASAPFSAVIEMPTDGWPDASHLKIAERALLSPIAATLAMLAGNSAAAIAADPAITEMLLPIALALATRDGSSVAGLANVTDLYPAQDLPMPTHLNGRDVVDLANGRGVAILDLSGIKWDDDGDGVDLPGDLIASVDSTWNDDNGIVDILSDHYGFCISGIESITELRRNGTPIEYDLAD